MARFVALFVVAACASQPEPDPSGTKCKTDADCPEAQLCNEGEDSYGRPLATCTSGCRTDADCPARQVCQQLLGHFYSQCVTGCRTDADCGDTFHCSDNGTCESRPIVGLTVDGTYVYYAMLDGEIARVPSSGGLPGTLAVNQYRPQTLVANETTLYFTTSDTCTPPGSSPAFEPASPFACLGGTSNSDGTVTSVPLALYWTESYADGDFSRIVTMAKTSDTVEYLASDQRAPTAIAVDDAWVYWINRGTAKGGTLAGRASADGEIARVPKLGGSTDTLASALRFRPPTLLPSLLSRHYLVVDRAYVYWNDLGDADGAAVDRVMRVPKDGGAAEMVTLVRR